MRSLKQVGWVCVLAVSSGCRSAWSGEQKPIPAADLAVQYSRSSTDIRSKYDGKEILVKGFASASPTMARGAGDAGSLTFAENTGGAGPNVVCWFSSDQSDKFAKVNGGSYVIVKGVFNGEGGINLKFCKLVNVE